MKEISMEKVEAARQAMLETVKSKSLTHEQKVATMANHADSLLSVLDLPEGLLEVLRCEPEKQCICDLFEGNAPMRPRYIIPDYEKFFREGSAFLQVEPPKDLYEAINALQIFYKHVPSVTNYPVYVGQLDTLLDPFVQDMDEELAFKMIKLFCIQMDRTILDSFAHANIGPKATKAGRLLLRAMAETKDAVPNLTLKYDEELTEDDFAIEAIRCAMASAKPSFCNHRMYSKDFSGNYVIASCYNGLAYGGGAYTLVRLIISWTFVCAIWMSEFVLSWKSPAFSRITSWRKKALSIETVFPLCSAWWDLPRRSIFFWKRKERVIVALATARRQRSWG